MHHGTVLKTLLLLLSVITGLHRILGQNSFFLTDAIASFIGHYGVAQDSRSEFYFFFVTDTIASVIGYYGVAEDSGSKSFFLKKWSHSPIRQDTNSVSRVLQAANTSVLSVMDQNNKRDE